MTLFGTAGIRGDVRERLTPELALAVGRAAGTDAVDREDASADIEFVIARDGRETGPALAAALEAGLESAGTTVRRAGVLPTPALAFASRGRRGVMVTASHNPPTDNGLKLFADGEEYGDDAEARIESRVEEDGSPAAWHDWGNAERIDPLAGYRDRIADYAEGHGAALDGIEIVVDCGNGMASRATPQVLRALGADVVALNANVDGHFPARGSKPTPETLGDLQAFLGDDDGDTADRTDGPTLGIAHDGDADRVVFLDETGEIVHEDTIVAILAEHYTRASDAADPVVVTTPNASSRIDERVAAAGGRVERVRLGALHVGIAAVREAGDIDTSVVFAAEPWKHIHSDLGPWIDGVASAAVFSRLVAEQGLAALREPIAERPYRKVSVDCPDDRKDAVMRQLATTLPEAFPDADIETEHGVRLDLNEGWVLVRPSGTEPKVRVYAESEQVDELREQAVTTVEAAVED
ncbi:phosphomannomutase [Halococcus saccharolyticus]|uniref:Phosphomannomutase n=1 Tax=Halococcus saccharolyticus DSM 5350 TaxID=1227455 RepID=M0ME61_9EURY|nr:phosphomannomutase [Halococcus saccharolyticus]EMA44042.1 phosphomannomutase [Halococcus saccharolyticus DSM 5350]